MNWNQSFCDDCWVAENPDREAHRMVESVRRTETCAMCGRSTRSGIYQRRHPSTVNYPAADD